MSEDFISVPAGEEVEEVEEQVAETTEAPSDQAAAHSLDAKQEANETKADDQPAEVKEEQTHANEANVEQSELEALNQADQATAASDVVAAAAARAQSLAQQFAHEASNADQGSKRKLDDDSSAPDAKRHAPDPFQQPPSTDSEVTEVINASADKIGRLIGRSGATIQAIQTQGGCRVKVIHEAIGGIKPVHLSGTPEAVARTKALCLLALETGSIDGAMPASPAPAPAPAPAYPTPSSHASSVSMVLSSSGGLGSDPSTRKISCPSHMIGRIIGRGGETIRSLQVRAES
jgi:far upstream element-binding protein